ncbi:protein of unknown function DUF1279 [Trinorchestia longiramus]|nr:protein of unknown function DUF1279 [Trinorchestia longiramus]
MCRQNVSHPYSQSIAVQISSLCSSSHQSLRSQHSPAYNANILCHPLLSQPAHFSVPSSPNAVLLSYWARTGALGKRWMSSSAKDGSSKENRKSNKIVDESELSLFARFKLMYRQYWYVLLPVHGATSIVWYGSFFLAAKNGVEIVPLLEAMGVTSEKILGVLKDSNAGYYAIAYAMYKVATPARYTVTLGCTTFSINYLKNKGHIKPVPSKEELREMYQDKKDEMIERKDEMMEKFEERREELRGRLEDRRNEMAEKHQAFRQRFETGTKEMRSRIEGRKDEMKDKLEQLNSVQKFQKSLETSSTQLKNKALDAEKIKTKLSKIDRRD